MKELDYEIDEEIEGNKDELIKIIVGVLDKGANYSIKSMSVNEHLQDLLLDVKKVITDSEFKQILKTAINSSLKDGQELKSNNGGIKQIESMLNLAFKGGLPELINLGIEIVTAGKKYGNIFSNYIEDFVNKLKNYAISMEFKNKVYSGLDKCLNKVEKFKNMCTLWYNAYNQLNIEDIQLIAGNLKDMKNKVKFNNECLNENEVIQNITELITKKKDRLSNSRMDIYENLQEI